MRRHWAYFKYVVRHKWFVFLACRQLHVSLHISILHDWTKFQPIEWFAYARQFYNHDGSKRQVRDASGAYDPNRQSEDFQRAWLHHQRLKHHWQAWISLGDGGHLSPLGIPDVYLREMIADWIGAGRAISGRTDPNPWYDANRDKIILHPASRQKLKEYLEILHEQRF